MKIIIVGTAYPLRGAMAQLNAILASYLSKKHTVEIVSFTRQYPKLFFPGKTQIDPSKPLFDLQITPLIDSINPLTWLQAGRYIRRKNPDLVIFRYWLPFFGPCFGTIAKLAKWNTAVRVLFICDNIIPHERRPGDVIFTKYVLKQADYCIVHSHAVEQDLKTLFPDIRHVMVPLPIYEVFGTPCPKDEARKILGITVPRVLLYFGFVRPYKGLMVLLDAMKHIQAWSVELGQILLIIVGEFYDDESKYRQRAKELGIESHVRFVSGYVPNEQVSTYFSAADVVALPYLSATQSAIIQIAYNFDKPVIATDVGGLAEVVLHGRTGFVVPPNNPEAIASAVKKFYEGQYEPEFAANVKQERKKYSWENIVKAIEDLLS